MKLILSVFIVAGAAATQAQYFVPGFADPYLAGMPNGTNHGGDVAPAQSPTLVAGILAGGDYSFSVTGSVSYSGGTPIDPPDGQPGGWVQPGSANGLSNVNSQVDSLLGVFLDDSQPDGFTPPEMLDFSPSGVGMSFTNLAPSLRQIFFIGDGLTGIGTGSSQHFIAPTGATRLYFASVDGSGWFNNTGSFSVNVAGPVPEPASLTVLGLGAVAFFRRKRIARA